MAYPKLLSSADILKAAVDMVERDGPDGLSLRALASALGVKAPSLYRYFPQKEALEAAVAQEIWNVMLSELQTVSATADPAGKFRATAEIYLRFARGRFPLYMFLLQHGPSKTYGSKASKAVWGLLLDAVSGVSEQRDNSAGVVAVWSFLHGYATLEHAGAFGVSGPKGGWELGLEAFLSGFRNRARPSRRARRPRASRR